MFSTFSPFYLLAFIIFNPDPLLNLHPYNIQMHPYNIEMHELCLL